MKNRIIIFLMVVFVSVALISSKNVKALQDSEEYVHTQIITVGDYGKATVSVVCSVDKNSKEIWFDSFGDYKVTFNTGKSFMLKSRSKSNIVEDQLMSAVNITLVFTGTDVNTHISEDLKYTYTITYDDLADLWGFE